MGCTRNGGSGMEQRKMRLDVLEILAGLCSSQVFRDVQKKMKGACFLLEYLMESDGVSTPGTLASLLQVSGARITVLLSALQEKHYVERQIDPADKRRVTVLLTDSGRAFVQEMRGQVFSFADEVCNALGEADTEQLIRISKKLLDAERTAQGQRRKGGAQA